MKKTQQPNTSGLQMCWTFFQLFMQSFLLEDHKLLDLFAQHSPCAHSFIPPPSSSATHAFSSCCHSLGEDSSTAEAPLPLHLHNITVVEVLLFLTINPCKQPPLNSQAGPATDASCRPSQSYKTHTVWPQYLHSTLATSATAQNSNTESQRASLVIYHKEWHKLQRENTAASFSNSEENMLFQDSIHISSHIM